MSKIKETIMARQNCPETRAERIEKNLLNIHEELRPLLQAWLDTGNESDDTMYAGYSLNCLKQDYGMLFTGALLTLDWLIRDPAAAQKALREGVR